MLSKLWLILLFIFFATTSDAAELEFDTLNVKQLKQIYDIYNYHGDKEYLMLDNYKYPAILLKHFPTDFNKISDETERNALFIKIVAPLALKVNQDILSERKELIKLNEKFTSGQTLTPQDIQKLENFAIKYDAFTRLKGTERQKLQLKELLLRVNFISPSVLITAAAIETNWGTSRIVKEGNSLYKMLAWHTKEGLKPIGETEDDSYRIKTYPDLYSSIAEFALHLNSEYKYDDLRDVRANFLFLDNIPFGSVLAPYLIWKSPLKNYAGMFQYTLAYYELNVIDKSSLDSTISSEKLPRRLQKLLSKKNTVNHKEKQ